jgi:hypothetical protein
MNSIWLAVYWVLGASILGLFISGVFSGWLKLSRRVFLVPYVLLTSIFMILFFRANEINLISLISENWIWGLILGIAVGVLLMINVRSQPSSRQTTGSELAFNIVWLGLVYGLIDALFLNVMPVIAILMGFSQHQIGSTWFEKIGIGILALLASLLVTFTYHIGYSEFRNKSVRLVLIGNTIITLAYLLSANPLGAILSHTLMHIAATIQGAETTLQLPPHRFPIQEKVVE